MAMMWSRRRTGAGAVSTVRQEKPDLILLDLSFPPDVAHGGGVAWDGFVIMNWLRRLEEAKNIPIIVITGGDPAKFKDRALAAGAVSFFHKPINNDELLTVIRETLAKMQRRHSRRLPHPPARRLTGFATRGSRQGDFHCGRRYAARAQASIANTRFRYSRLLAGNRLRAFVEVEDLHGDKALVADLLQGGGNGFEVHIAEARPFQVPVVRMEVGEVRPRFADDLRDGL